MTTIRDTASVSVSEPVNGGTPAPRTRRSGSRSGRVIVEQVHPLVMAVARARVREGERIIIESPTVVRMVHQ